ncbi:MAG: electron transfer flavoprotein subunit alpha/FixB family protein, partial [Chloroflexi bacterium]|nr:electron transfer flavoprotein subunit alpha/FixB family protein [Chloroflexota bacterium]
MAGQRIWTFVELQGGTAKKVSFEILTKARELGEAEAVILGPGAQEAAKPAGQYGAKKVHLSEDAAYAECLVLPIVDTLQALIEREKPTAVLFGSTDLGKDVASRLAAQLNVGLLSEAVDIAFKDSQIEVTRPDFGGTVMCTSTLRTDKTSLVLV